jgi:uncharacterized protein
MGVASELSAYAPSRAEMARMLREARTIAVVGLSSDPTRPSLGVAEELQGRGYRIVPVNPNETEVLGERAYGSLTEVSVPVDLVDVFRRPEHTPAVAREAVSIGAKGLWLQLGIVNEEARLIAEEGGLRVVMGICIRDALDALDASDREG